jgi:hypothetical protein
MTTEQILAQLRGIQSEFILLHAEIRVLQNIILEMKNQNLETPITPQDFRKFMDSETVRAKDSILEEMEDLNPEAAAILLREFDGPSEG